ILIFVLSATHMPHFFFNPSNDRRVLHSFPTRRSSDLVLRAAQSTTSFLTGTIWSTGRTGAQRWTCCIPRTTSRNSQAESAQLPRSEEHTSELQSRENLVCRLLLEKNNIVRQKVKVSTR